MYEFEYLPEFGSYNITAYTGIETDLDLPEDYDDGINGLAPVTHIGLNIFNVFDNKGLTSIIIPEGYIYIGGNAFSNNKLTTLLLPTSMKKIDTGAFSFNELADVTLNEGLVELGTNVVFANNFITSITIPSTVTIIGSNCFSNNELEEIEIPKGVFTIGIGFAGGNNLTKVVWNTGAAIPFVGFRFLANAPTKLNQIEKFIISVDTVVELGDVNAFSTHITPENPMTVYVQPQLIEDYKTATNWSTLYADGRVIFEVLRDFRNVGDLYIDTLSDEFNNIELTTQETLDQISAGNIDAKKGILYISNKKSPATELQTQNGVITPDELIDNLTNGGGAEISPNGIDYLRDPAKTYLVIKIPEDNDTFELLTGNSGSPDYTVEWGDGASETITDTTNPTHEYATAGMYLITISGGFSNGIVYGTSFNANKNKIIEVYGGSNYPLSGGSTFYGCTSLTTVNFPKATSIGGSAFFGCSSLTTVNVPKATRINSNAFYNCTSLTTVNSPNITRIDNSAFRNCSSLITANFPKVTSIEGGAFQYCSSLKELTLGNVTTAGIGSRFENVKLINLKIAQDVTNTDIDRIKQFYADNGGTFTGAQINSI